MRYFTLAEANETVNAIRPVMSRLLERRARAARQFKGIQESLADLRSDVGSPEASLLVQDFQAIERMVADIQAHGCQIKDLNAGLVDFLAQREGRDVFLCWRFGEPEVAFYHELDGGYAGRRPIG